MLLREYSLLQHLRSNASSFPSRIPFDLKEVLKVRRRYCNSDKLLGGKLLLITSGSFFHSRSSQMRSLSAFTTLCARTRATSR